MAKFDLIKTSKLKFARFGGLSSVNQEGYSSRKRKFHTPPAGRGFYSFVWPLYEPFLLGGSWTAWPWVIGSKFSYVKDEKGEIVTDKHPEHEKYSGLSKIFSVPTKAWNKNRESAGPDGFDEDFDDYTEKQRNEMHDAAEKDWEDNHKNEPRWMYAKKPKPRIFTYEGELWHHLGENLKPHHIISTKGSWVKSSMEDYRYALEREMHNYRKQPTSYRMKTSDKNPFQSMCKDHLEVFIEKI